MCISTMDALCIGNATTSIEPTSMEMTTMKPTSMDMASIDWAGLSDDNRRGWLMVGGETDKPMAEIGQWSIINHTPFLNSLANGHSVDVSPMPIGVSCSVGVSSIVVSTISTNAVSEGVSSRDVSAMVDSSEADVVEVLKVVLGRDEVPVDGHRSADQDWTAMVDYWCWCNYDRSCYIEYFSSMPLISTISPIPAVSSIDDNRGHCLGCGMDINMSVSIIVLDVDPGTVHHDFRGVQMNGGRVHMNVLPFAVSMVPVVPVMSVGGQTARDVEDQDGGGSE